MVLAIGASSRVADLTYLWRRPGLLLRSLLAMYVAVPLVAVSFAAIMPIAPAIKAALLVLAVSAGAPLLPRKLGAVGDAYVFSLLVTSSLLAIVIAPIWVALLARYFGVSGSVSPVRVATLVATAFLLPLLAGILCHVLAPSTSERIALRLFPIAGVVLCVAGAAVLVRNWDIVLEMRVPGLMALLLLIVVALAIGHWLGGPSPNDRTALAIACATRHIGVAVAVAGAFRGPRTLVLVGAYVITSAIVSIPYLRWRRYRASTGMRARLYR